MFEVASRPILEFGPFRLDTDRRLLFRDGEAVPLTHKAFETLALLVENRGRVVEKDELLSEIWPDTFVEEGSLARNVSVLRKALGEGPSDHHYIQTIPKQGYRFVAPVREVVETGEEPLDQAAAALGGGITPATIEKPVVPARRAVPYVVGAALFGLAVFSLIAMYMAFYSSPSQPAEAPKLNVTRFTSSGKAMDAAISPDGKYVVYVINDSGKQSLWVKQVASGSEVQIVEPADVHYQGLAFTSDGNFVYYNVWDKIHVGEIYRIPVLGGVSNRVINDVMPMMSVSPDDREIVFVRSVAASSESLLIVANVDGSQERILARLGGNTKGWFGGPAWSPDGKWIALVLGGVGEQGQSYVQVARISSSGGEPEVVSERRFVGTGALAWHANGKDIVLAATDKLQAPNQLWRVDTVTGEAKQITNDLSGYNGLSLTADSRSLVATQGDFQSNIYVGGSSMDSEWRRLTSGRYEGLNLAWTPDGRLVFVSQESGNDDIWIMNSDGSERRRLTSDPNIDANPTVSSDGKYLFFVSLRSGVPHIYRMELGGGDATQITNGLSEWGPMASPTGSIIVYQTTDNRGLWKMAIDGSGQTRLNDAYSYLPAFSADGERLIFSYWDDAAKPEQLRQAFFDLASGKQTDLPTVPRSAIRYNSQVTLRWAPDGKSYAYIDDRDGVSNLWRQPLGGGDPEQITNFNDNYIYTFDWAKDGRLAVARGSFAFDVVLITGLE
ncbi:MAG TPA: winged helix-turn-helix domain-containing protein [Pyrinomonadaceae bacterium]